VQPERCWLLAVGVFRWTGARLVVVVGVPVDRNVRTAVWCSAADQVWPVVCPHASSVGCGALPVDA
jgi:hypothetical protein